MYSHGLVQDVRNRLLRNPGRSRPARIHYPSRARSPLDRSKKMVYDRTPILFSEGSSLMFLSPDYVVGLVDGEGSFTFRINTNPNRRNLMEPRFYLKLRAEDKTLLDALQGFFSCGKVYIQNDRRPRHSLCYRFEVGNRRNLREKVLPFFLKNPPKTPSKLRDFHAFCEAMEIVFAGRHLSEEGIAKLSAIKAVMH